MVYDQTRVDRSPSSSRSSAQGGLQPYEVFVTCTANSLIYHGRRGINGGGSMLEWGYGGMFIVEARSE